MVRADSRRIGASDAMAFGSNTTALGSGSFATGYGGNAGGNYSTTEGYSCYAGDRSHAEGNNTYANGGTGAHAEGHEASASGTGCHAEGYQTNAGGSYAHAEGYQSTAFGNFAHAQGQQAAARALAQHAQASGWFTQAGDAQASTFVARRQTTDATPAPMTFSGSAPTPDGAASCNVLTIPVNRAHQFTTSVIARRSDVAGDIAGWKFTGVVYRGSTGDAVLAGTTQVQTWATAGSGAWDVTLSVDTTSATNNYLQIMATGEAAKTIRWVARIDTVEVG